MTEPSKPRFPGSTALHLKPYSEDWRQVWNDVNRAATNGHFMFSREFIDYHGNRFDERSLIAFRRGKPLALLPLTLHADGVRSHAGLPSAGLIVHPALRFDEYEDLLQLTVAHLSSDQAGPGWLYYSPVPFPYWRHYQEADQWVAEELSGSSGRDKVGLCLRMGSPAPLNHRNRTKVRTMMLRGMRLLPPEQLALSDAYHFMCVTLQRRHAKEPLHTLDEFNRICRTFPGRIVAVGAEQKGELLAALILWIEDHVVRFQGIGYDEGMDGSDAVVYAFSRAIETAEWSGRWLDLGTSMVPETGAISRSLVSFKESLGARIYVQRTYRIPLGKTAYHAG